MKFPPRIEMNSVTSFSEERRRRSSSRRGQGQVVQVQGAMREKQGGGGAGGDAMDLKGQQLCEALATYLILFSAIVAFLFGIGTKSLR